MERVPVLLQVNVDLDASKSGFQPGDLAGSVDALASLGRIDVRGLMTIGREVADPEEARRTFAACASCAAPCIAAWSGLGPGCRWA